MLPRLTHQATVMPGSVFCIESLCSKSYYAEIEFPDMLRRPSICLFTSSTSFQGAVVGHANSRTKLFHSGSRL